MHRSSFATQLREQILKKKWSDLITGVNPLKCEKSRGKNPCFGPLYELTSGPQHDTRTPMTSTVRPLDPDNDSWVGSFV
jgi:hypothetical protein